VLLIPASGVLMRSEANDLTPALSLPRAYVIAAITVGLGLIAVLAILRLIDRDLRRVAIVIAVAIVLSFAGYAAAIRSDRSAISISCCFSCWWSA